ncbi:polysaccharide synthase [Coccidioides immitis RMSCC 2394]|uniref:Polysaccharide synthase n=1 Tax=Coccidioides immitis RMSCC 2394 TaxID=404692 RepID=A0A0J6YIF2_COCIT|nr:polysaccharide synthase [Coccidioides immitis RMSCC 2394]
MAGGLSPGLLLKPIPPSGLLDPADVTVVIPCINIYREKLAETLKLILKSDLQKLILVTVKEEQDVVKEIVTVQTSGKRRQLTAGIPLVSTVITVLADDDIIWKTSHLLQWMLAPFKKKSMGEVDTCQYLQYCLMQSLCQWVWSFLEALYLKQRNFDCAATIYMDREMPCISRQTTAYHT